VIGAQEIARTLREPCLSFCRISGACTHGTIRARRSAGRLARIRHHRRSEHADLARRRAAERDDLNSTKLSAIRCNRSNASRFCRRQAPYCSVAARPWHHQHHHKDTDPNQTSGSAFAGYVLRQRDVRAGANYAGERLRPCAECRPQESDNYRRNNRCGRTAWLATYATGWGNECRIEFGADLQSLQLPGVRTRSNMRRPAGRQTRETGQRRGELDAILWPTLGRSILRPTWVSRQRSTPTSRRPSTE